MCNMFILCLCFFALHSEMKCLSAYIILGPPRKIVGVVRRPITDFNWPLAETTKVAQTQIFCVYYYVATWHTAT